MILASFISQLRANAPVFAGRVAGAAEFVRGLRDYSTSLALPAAYVLPGVQDVADANETWGGLQQLVHYGVGVAVELDAQTDRREQAPAMDLDAVRDQVFASVLNYRIDDCHVARGAYYAGAHGLDRDRARLFYQFNFTVTGRSPTRTASRSPAFRFNRSSLTPSTRLERSACPATCRPPYR